VQPLLGLPSIGEGIVIAIVAVLIFGKNLPEVAGKVYAQLRKVRRAIDDLRRETGIDRDFHDIRRDMRDIEQEANVVDPLRRSAAPALAPDSQPIEDHRETDPAGVEPETEVTDEPDEPARSD